MYMDFISWKNKGNDVFIIAVLVSLRKKDSNIH